MTRTFSLRRLLFGMTVLCVVTGLAAKTPVEALRFAPVAICFVPALVVLVLVSLDSPRPCTTFLVGAFGAAIVFGFLLAEMGFPGPRDSSWRSLEISIGITTAIGALMFSAPCTIEWR